MKNEHLDEDHTWTLMLSGLEFKHLEGALDLISSHVIFLLLILGLKDHHHLQI